MKILLADGRLTVEEKKWFISKYPLSKIVQSIEESMWLLSILIEHIDVVKVNKGFFREIWSAKKDLYNLSNTLFLTYILKIRNTPIFEIQSFIKFLSTDSSRKFKKSLSSLKEGRVIEEEILIVLNFVFSKNYDLKDLNVSLSKDYLKRLFLSLKESDSVLKHLAVASLSLDDSVINSNEYEAMWKSFSSLSLNHVLLSEAFYDVSLLKLIDYEIGDYFTYLTQKTA